MRPSFGLGVFVWEAGAGAFKGWLLCFLVGWALFVLCVFWWALFVLCVFWWALFVLCVFWWALFVLCVFWWALFVLCVVLVVSVCFVCCFGGFCLFCVFFGGLCLFCVFFGGLCLFCVLFWWFLFVIFPFCVVFGCLRAMKSEGGSKKQEKRMSGKHFVIQTKEYGMPEEGGTKRYETSGEDGGRNKKHQTTWVMKMLGLRSVQMTIQTKHTLDETTRSPADQTGQATCSRGPPSAARKGHEPCGLEGSQDLEFTLTYHQQSSTTGAF